MLATADFSVVLAFAFFVICTCLIWVLFLAPKPKVGDFHNKYVFITGCDSGFGRETTIQLDLMGFHVFAACLTRKGKEGLEAECSERVKTLMMDVTNSEQIQNAYQEVKDMIPSGKGLWAVVNNAGIMRRGAIEWHKLTDYKRMADVNLWGLIDVTTTFLPLVKVARGRVINFSSIAGLISRPLVAPYTVSKYGVEAFSDALRREMAPWGVKVCILEPQAFKTPLWKTTDQQLVALWENTTEEIRHEYGNEFIDKVRQGTSNFFKKAPENTHLVIDTVVDAITSRNPNTRYKVGFQAWVIAAMAILPTSLQDWVVRVKGPMPVPQGAQSSNRQ